MTGYGHINGQRNAARDQQPSSSGHRGAAPVPQASSANGKGKAKQEALDSAPLEIQEALILEDLLFVLMVRA